MRKWRIGRSHSTKTLVESTLAVSGLFYGVGYEPNTTFLESSNIAMDKDGYISTGWHEYPTSPNIKSIFAAGDVQDKKYRQAITSACSGCMAALDCNEFLDHVYN